MGREGCPASCAHPQRVPLLPWCSTPRLRSVLHTHTRVHPSLARLAVPSCAPVSAAALRRASSVASACVSVSSSSGAHRVCSRLQAARIASPSPSSPPFKQRASRLNPLPSAASRLNQPQPQQQLRRLPVTRPPSCLAAASSGSRLAAGRRGWPAADALARLGAGSRWRGEKSAFKIPIRRVARFMV